MHIRRVQAFAFGALRDAELHLAPGLTVVSGPNESGKSTWHAAVYAALCGMRRARGGLPRADRDFADRHRPWDGERWEVGCEVVLADGRVVELRHDLAGRVACRAIDLATGQDVSDVIVHDGAPDGSRWLGLDRRAFAAVACVRQAEILAVTGDAGALREHLQRAAATAGTDETAAAALGALAEFRSEHVGSERAPTRPLARARARAQQAERAHAEARRRHEGWLEAAATVERLEALAAEAEARLHTAEATAARAELERLEARVEQARALAERHPEPPADDREPLLEQAADAVRAWRQRPEPVALDGETAAELAARLEALPAEPDGDTTPAPEVLAAARALEEAVSRAGLHDENRPAGRVAAGVAGDLTESDLIDLARAIDAAVPAADGRLHDEVAAARAARDQVRATRRRPYTRRALAVLLAGAVTGGALGAAGGAAGRPAVWGAGVATALVAALVALVLARRTAGPDPLESERAESRLRDAEARLAVAEQVRETAERQREAAATRAAERGLPTDPAALRRLAEELRRAEAAERDRRRWQERHEELARAVAGAAADLAAALEARGISTLAPVDPAGGDAGAERAEGVEPAVLLGAVDAYRDACRQRAAQATEAAQRPALVQAIEARRRLEAEAATANRRRSEAADSLRDAAIAAGLAGVPPVPGDGSLDACGDPDAFADRLEAWVERRRAELAARRQEWTELQALLGGAPLSDLEATLAARRARVTELEARLGGRCAPSPERGAPEVRDPGARPGDLGRAGGDGDPEALLAELRSAAAEAKQRAVAARAELQRDGEQLPSVAAAEEELAAARAELERVEHLDRVLACTEELLQAAQERVHRDIAPVVGRKVQERLARVTGGRYTEVTVDPQDLAVKVRDPDGHLREAGRLSHGTAEQVYLLLRVAMAEILTGDGSRCPLLLDDVTVQSDPERTVAVLDVLHDVSIEHQVVLFTQEHDVVRWAADHLGSRDALVELAPSGTGRPVARLVGGRQPAA